jgi:hypothetical protein
MGLSRRSMPFPRNGGLCAVFIAALLLSWAATGTAAAKTSPPGKPAKTAAVSETEALRRAQDRVVEHYRRHQGLKSADRAGRAGKAPRSGAARGRLEQLSCRLGTEDRHARIAVELIGGRVKSFAYYSKWKPRTCSVYIVRDDAYSQWKDTGGVTLVTLNEEKGAFLIDHGRRAVKFLFRDIDRERFCGMEGKITGSLTVTRGRSRCELEGVMDEGPDQIRTTSPVS